MNTHYKINGYALNLCNAFGFLTPGELFLLQALARSLPAGSVVVNIGAGAGTSGLGIVEINPALNVYTIDISPSGPLGGLENERNAFEPTDLRLPTQILGDSHLCWKDWKKPIDLLLVDGDHFEEGLKKDMAGWLPLVKPGGYAVYHDYDSIMWSGITHVIDEGMLPPEWDKVLLVDTLIAFRKVPQGIKTIHIGPDTTPEIIYEPVDEPKIQPQPIRKNKGKK